MNYRKIILELLVTFFISFFLQSIVDNSVFTISEWDKDTIEDLTHTWLTLISSYYIYNACLKFAFVYWKNISKKKLNILLFCVSFIVFSWVIVTDLLFYKIYCGCSLNETSFYKFDIAITVVVLTIGSLFFFQKYYVKPLDNAKPNSTNNYQKLTVTKGKKQIFIDYRDVGLVYIENEIVKMQTLSGKKYYIEDSLLSIMKKLCATSFFRLNRQVIVSRAVIKGFEKLEYQKLHVLLIEDINYGAPIIVSKYNAPAFKEWLTNS